SVRVLDDVDEPILGQLPDGLRLVREERRISAEQPSIPIECAAEVADRDAGEYACGHDQDLLCSGWIHVGRTGEVKIDGSTQQRMDRFRPLYQNAEGAQ